MSAFRKILTVPLRISIALLLMGMLMKVLEWPLASQIMLVSFIAIALLYIVRFWKKGKVQFIDYVKLILVTFWTLNGVLRVLDFQYSIFFQIITAISFIIWFILEGTAYFLDDDRKAKNSNAQLAWNFSMVVGTLCIISGSLLKLLNWNFAIPLLVFGIAVVTAYILKDVFPFGKVDHGDEGNGEILY